MSGFIQELTQATIYKRNQGRIARQVTFAALAVIMGLGLWRLSDSLSIAEQTATRDMVLKYGLPGLLLALGLWVAYRVVNMPKFADFLIAVEAEMNKVSWPTRTELFRASMVVLVTIFVLAAMLWAFDVFWGWVFTFLGIFPEPETLEEAPQAALDFDWKAVFSVITRVF